MMLSSICRTFPYLSIAGGFLLAMAASPAHANIEQSEYGCYSFSFDVAMPGTPEEVYNAATGDISGWWDHTFSDSPESLYIDALPGGSFREIFDKQGNGANHASVIFAKRGRLLRLHGPLGFSGKAMDGVFTYRFTADGENTILGFEGNLAGQITAGEASAVEEVWHHFLEDRLKPYLESGSP